MDSPSEPDARDLDPFFDRHGRPRYSPEPQLEYLIDLEGNF